MRAKKLKKEKCPKCGQEFDPKLDEILTCPKCEEDGSTACCNIGGRGTPCNKCDTGEDEE